MRKNGSTKFTFNAKVSGNMQSIWLNYDRYEGYSEDKIFGEYNCASVFQIKSV